MATRLALPTPVVSRHGEQLSGGRELSTLPLEVTAQIGDECQEAVRVVAQWPGVTGPLQLASQQPLGLVAFGPDPLGPLLGGADSLPGLFHPPLSDGGALSPVLGLSPGPLGRRARSGHFGASHLSLGPDGFGPSQLRRPTQPVGALALRFA
jgi:hypothetical protein